MSVDKYTNQDHGGDPMDALNVFKQVVRITGGVVGVVAMVVGLFYGVKILKLVYDLIALPEENQPVRQLADLMGGAELTMSTAHGMVPLAMPLSVVLLVAALLIFGWLALGLILAGSRVMAFCLTDREAIRELISYAFDRKKLPQKLQPEEPAKR